MEEEETYEPPEDPDSGLTLEELGLRALQRLPREHALDGIRAFNEMRCVLTCIPVRYVLTVRRRRDSLMDHLRPFALEGKEVTEGDIRAFFDARMNGNRAA